MTASSAVPLLRILHFNDVYSIFEGRHEPVGGAARFVAALSAAREEANELSLPTLTAFSGDVFSPSVLTPETKGAEMSLVLNAAQVDVACIGNHDVDWGVDVMYRRISETTFPWILSNASFSTSKHCSFDTCASHLSEWHVIERGGAKFGVMGLIPLEWLDTLSRVPAENVEYEDFVVAADRISHILRVEEKCDFIIALTHMRQRDDERLANEARDVDLILAGHDHTTTVVQVNGRYIVKSGTDFRTFGAMDIARKSDGSLFVLSTPKMTTVTKKFKEDMEVKKIVDKYSDIAQLSTQTELGSSEVDLDGRFCSIRSRETALGNLVADVMVQYTGAEIGLINGGSFRSDRIHPHGRFLEQDLTDILPFQDSVVAMKLTGQQVWNGLENSISRYPALEGRFCQVSRIKFSFDPLKTPGSRIEEVHVLGRDGNYSPLRLDRVYITAVKGFLSRGNDGFECLSREPKRVLSETGPDLHITALVRHFFRKSGPFELGDVNGIKSGPFVVNPIVEGRIVCLNPDEGLERMCATTVHL